MKSFQMKQVLDFTNFTKFINVEILTVNSLNCISLSSKVWKLENIKNYSHILQSHLTQVHLKRHQFAPKRYINECKFQ